MIVRPAIEADLAAITAILEANDEPVSWPAFRAPRTSITSSTRPEPAPRTASASSTAIVAGLAGSIEVGGPTRRFLTDLYVDPRASRAAWARPCSGRRSTAPRSG